MQRRRETSLTTPALIPIAGNCDRRPRYLERDVITVGRARGCDLCLEANEISTLHCIIYRSAEGYRIRDCNSRCGTRINGETIKSGKLNDSDIVHIGAFSFEFRLPPALFPNENGKVDSAKVEHLKKSRRKLGQLALKARHRARQGPASVNEREWAQKAHLLKEKIRCYDQRLQELEGAEGDLDKDRQKLEREQEAHLQRVQNVETELANRLAAAEEEIRKRWQAFQQRCQVEESRAPRPAAPAPTNAVPAPTNAAADPDLNQLRRHVQDLEQQLARQQDQLQREQEEFTKMKEQWVKAQSKSSAALEDQQAALAAQEASVRAQKAELSRMMAELKKLQEDLRKQAKGDIRSLQEDLDRAQRENAELRISVEKSSSSPGGDVQKKIDDLQAEVELLNEELANKEATLRQLDEAHGNRDVAGLEKENELLKKLIEEKSQATGGNAPPKTESDLERYESELNEFRRQLEDDRVKLNKEVEMLRDRNKELDEAIREMEMEMSKERAELARERIRQERLQEQIKTDMEKLQREAAVRDSMAPVQKLRDEINGKQPAKGEKPLNDRLRGIRKEKSGGSPSTAS